MLKSSTNIHSMSGNSKLDIDVKRVLDGFEKTQWRHKPNFFLINKMPIISRQDLRKIEMEKGYYMSKTSGSTGEPVTIQKSYLDYVWYLATNIREIRWRKWDVTKNIAIIRPGSKTIDTNDWGIPRNIEPIQGKTFKIGYEPISVIQKWLEEKNPDYLHCNPSIVKQLDLSKLNIIDIKGSGEMGGSLYSSEECGTIAIECPDNPNVKHVMENIICEVDEDGGLIVTSLTNPYIKRYKHGDHIELGECNCGRTLQTITEIKGRVRNMFVLPNGDKKWPLLGTRDIHEEYGIKRFKMTQTSIEDLIVEVISKPLLEKEESLISTIKSALGVEINVSIKYVNDFPNYKFEEFVSLVK